MNGTERVELTTLQPITLSTVSAGEVERQFQDELEKVRAVLADKDLSGACSVMIKLDLIPEEGSTNFVRVQSTVSSKLPPRKLSRVVMMRDGVLLEDTTSTDARQPGLFPVNEKAETLAENG